MENDRKLIHVCFFTSQENAAHYHQNLEILYILNGEMEIQIDDTIYNLKNRDFILVNANKNYIINVRKSVLGVRFVIDYRMMAEAVGNPQLLFWCNSAANRNDAYEDMRMILDQILKQYFEKDDRSSLHLQSLYYEVLHLLVSNFKVKADDVRLTIKNSQDCIRINEIQNYIQANYQSQIRLNNLAKKLYLSNAYLSKYIKRHMGLTFHEYLNNVRLFHAVDELLYTNKNITRVALDNGFTASATFARVFRDIYKESPSAYRKRVQSLTKETTSAPEEEEKEQEFIQQYLDLKKKEKSPQIKNSSLLCEADAEKSEYRNMFWNKAVNVGEACLLLRPEIQNQLREIRQGTGMVYVRIWNVLPQDDCFDECRGYNFRTLDQVLDFLLEIHMKPYIELEHKAEGFVYRTDRCMKEAVKESGLCRYSVFCEMIKTLCMHLANRYGSEEMESWYFEYWNGRRFLMAKEDGEYYRYFEAVYHAFKQISSAIKVGGAGFILNQSISMVKDTLRKWKAREVHPDFISFSFCQYTGQEFSDSDHDQKSADENDMKKQIEMVSASIKEMGFQVPELHIDEWNFTVSNHNEFNDSCAQGAYIMKTCIDLDSQVDCMAYWYAMDSSPQNYDSKPILNGDSGMISRDGIRKPSFYAFHFLDKLQQYVIAKNDNSIVTTNRKGRYVIACHNYKKLLQRYVFMETDEIRTEEFMDNVRPLEIQFRLDHVKNGKYLIRIYYLNENNGNIQKLWKKLDFQKQLLPEEIENLKKRAVPALEMHTVEVTDGCLELKSLLMIQEIRLLDIRYQYNL